MYTNSPIPIFLRHTFGDLIRNTKRRFFVISCFHHIFEKMLIQITILIGLLIIWWNKKSTKPANFPPGPQRYPIFGSYFETVRPGEKRPNLFWSVRKFAKQYGNIFGFYLNNTPFVVLTDYEDIKEILKKGKQFRRELCVTSFSNEHLYIVVFS